MGRKAKSKSTMALSRELAKLQSEFADIDFWHGEPGVIRLMVRILEDMTLRMDANKNHKRPHIHVDYGTEYHTASYAIDTGARIAGNLKNHYDRKVKEWIADCRPSLMEAWVTMQAGKNADAIICKLRGSLR